MGKIPKEILAIIIIGLIIRILYAFFNPAFNSPDELPHFKYVKFVCEEKQLPIALHQVEDPHNDWEYHQPPFYYLLMSPIYGITKSLKMIRLFSVLLSLGVIYLVWLISKSWAATAFVSFLPTYVGLSASVNNDVLLIFVFSLAFYLFSIKYKNPFLWGVLIGLSATTKTNGILLALIPLMMFLEMKKPRLALYSFALGFLFCSWWFARNWLFYGDFTALSVGNIFPNNPINEETITIVVNRIYTTFWMTFGVRSHQILQINFLWTGFALATFIIIRGMIKTFKYNFFYRANIYLIFLFVILAVDFAFKFGQPQGRFLYPVLVPLAICFSEGLRWKKEDEKDTRRLEERTKREEIKIECEKSEYLTIRT